MAWIRGKTKNENGADADNGDSNGKTDLSQEPWFLELKRDLHQRVISSMDLSSLGTMSQDQLRLEVRREAESLCRRQTDLLNLDERERLVNEVLDETFGLGPLESLMKDPAVTDILIN